MLKIRLSRHGRTNVPAFRVVVTDHREAAKGHYIEAVGFYNPKIGELKIDKEKIKHWLDRGAKPSDRIARLLKKEGMKHKFIVIHERPARAPKVKKTASESGVAPQTAVPTVKEEVKKEKQAPVEAAEQEPKDKE
jgi:small subunit ribosomal protein S16